MEIDITVAIIALYLLPESVPQIAIHDCPHCGKQVATAIFEVLANGHVITAVAEATSVRAKLASEDTPAARTMLAALTRADARWAADKSRGARAPQADGVH